MVMFTRIVGVGDQSPVTETFDAPSEQDATRATLEKLQSIVQNRPCVLSAAVVFGEGNGVHEPVKWLGGWVWDLGKGFAWSEMD
jgi:hypothetical protein